MGITPIYADEYGVDKQRYLEIALLYSGFRHAPIFYTTLQTIKMKHPDETMHVYIYRHGTLCRGLSHRSRYTIYQRSSFYKKMLALGMALVQHDYTNDPEFPQDEADIYKPSQGSPSQGTFAAFGIGDFSEQIKNFTPREARAYNRASQGFFSMRPSQGVTQNG